MVWLTGAMFVLLLVAVNVIVYVPAGVPWGFGNFVLAPEPPPQPAMMPAISSVQTPKAGTSLRLRRGVVRSLKPAPAIAANTSSPSSSQGFLSSGCGPLSRAALAVVLTSIVTNAVLFVREGGVKLQVAP